MAQKPEALSPVKSNVGAENPGDQTRHKHRRTHEGDDSLKSLRLKRLALGEHDLLAGDQPR